MWRNLQKYEINSPSLPGSVGEHISKHISEKAVEIKEERRWSYAEYLSRSNNFNNDSGGIKPATKELHTPPSSSRFPSSPKRKLLTKESDTKNQPSEQIMNSPKKKRRNSGIELMAKVPAFSAATSLHVISRGSCRRPIKSNSAAAKGVSANSTASDMVNSKGVVSPSSCHVKKEKEEREHLMGGNEEEIVLRSTRKVSTSLPSSFSPKKCKRPSMREGEKESWMLTASFYSSNRSLPKQNHSHNQQKIESWPKTSNANNCQIFRFPRRSQRRVAQAAREKVRKILCSEDDKIEKTPSDDEIEFFGDETTSIASTSSDMTSLALAPKYSFVNNSGFIVLTKETLRKKGIVRGGIGRAFECQYCHKICTQRSNIIAHVRVHTGEKPFKCVKCYKAFTQKSNLKRHIKTHNLLYKDLYNQ